MTIALAATLLISQGASILITDVSVIDGIHAKATPHQYVLIEGEKIKSISNREPKSTAMQKVDGRGKFLIPGLWDMHIHWYDPRSLGLFTANGVTGVRVMYGAPMHLDWRRQIRAGKLVGPDLYIGGPIVDGPQPIWPGSIACKYAADGIAAVDKVKKDGYDFVKVYSLLPRDAYFAIARRSKQLKFPFEGHVPELVRSEEAAASGQASMEHLYGLMTSCSTKQDEIMSRAARPMAERRADRALAAETYDADKAKALFATLRKENAVQCPTLIVLKNMANQDRANFDDPRLQYMPKAFTTSWNYKNDFRLKEMTAEQFEAARRSFTRSLQLVGDLERAHVTIIAGTDCLNPFCFPGFSLHDELALLVEAGLKPFRALQTATKNAAEFMGRRDIGVIQAGKRADLVLLDADPLADIHNTARIGMVVQGGRLFGRSKLDDLLRGAKQAAGNSSEFLPAGFHDIH